MMVRRIVFLDFDGVLNSTAWLTAVAEGFARRPLVVVGGRTRYPAIDPDAVILLNELDRPGVEWVLSSTWRGDSSWASLLEVESIFRQLGWTGRFAGSTPIIRDGLPSIHADHSRGAQATRGDEIAGWLAAEGIPRSSWICILDDDSDISPLEDCLVRVDEQVGLTQDNVDLALVKLGLELADGEGDAIARALGGA